MGLFDSFKTIEGTFPMDEREAILLLLLGAVSCDGTLGEEEMIALKLLITRTRTLGPLPGAEMSASLERCLKVWNGKDKEDVMRKCAHVISKDLKESVFIHVCSLVLVDDELNEKEMHYVEVTQKLLGINDARGQTLVDAAIILKKL